MSSRKKKNQVLPGVPDVSAELAPNAVEVNNVPKVPRVKKLNHTPTIKAKLSTIIDMLSFTDDNFNEKTMRYNVSIAVRHLAELEKLL